MIRALELIRVDADENLTLNEAAVQILQESHDALSIFSFYGTKASGKTALLREILSASLTDDQATANELGPSPSNRPGVWMYVEETSYAHAKRVVYLDVSSYGENEGLDALLFGITACLSSNVVNCSVGQIDENAFDSLSFLQHAVEVLGEKPSLPLLTWIVRELATKDVKAIVNSSDPSADLDQLYLQAVLNPRTSPFTSSLPWQILTSFFPKRNASILPLSTSPAYVKKVQRLHKTLIETSKPKTINGVELHGSLFCHLLSKLLGKTTHITEVFDKEWDSVVQSDLLNLVELAFETYKRAFDAKMSNPQDPIKLPCDLQVLKYVHAIAVDTAQPLLAKVAALGKEHAALADILFKELSAKNLNKWVEENNQTSTAQCMAVLQSLHTEIEAEIQAKLKPAKEPLRLADFKMAVLGKFYSTLLPKYIDYLVQLGEQTMNQQTTNAEQEAVNGQKRLDQALQAKIDASDSIKNSQKEVQEKLVQNIHMEIRMKSVLQDALDDVTDLHEKAKLQGSALEAQAFNNVERTAERVLEVSQANKVDEGALEGYLIKQGGGGVFGRKNWKQRYFMLHKNVLSYAKTKDDYERGKILKEFSIVGCEIKDSMDAGEGFEVWPPSTGQAVYDYKQGLFGSDPTLGRRKVDGESDRIFYLRASTMEVKEQWVERLRRAVKQAKTQ
ncbi:unnamed protein product [Aphanomyces euteiches]|nr:hypothetical protein AeRB84_002097 [Aphanomyces euteiches]